MLVARSWLCIGALLAGASCGCSSRPAPPPKLKLDPGTAAAAAMQAYDKNSDGELDAEELKASPALADGLKRADTNGDGKLQTAELSERIRHLLNAPVTIVTGHVEVKLDGKPLAGAVVTFEPEPFYGDLVKPAHGATETSGSAAIISDDAQFPGYYLGYYKVRISKQEGGKELIPERYNTQTTLGCEAADETTNVGNIVYELTSK